MAKQPAQKQVARQATDERLLEAAIHEFAEHGFEQATVRDICARARANLNAVKYHFGDKQGLYFAAVKHAHTCAKHPPPPADEARPPAEQLRDFIAGMLEMALSEDRPSARYELLILREMADPTAATEEFVRAFIKPRFAQLDAILRELLPPSTATIDRHLFAMSVVGQCMHHKWGRRFDQLLISPSEYRRFTAPRLTDHIMRVIMAAIEAEHARAASSADAHEDEPAATAVRTDSS